MRNSVPRFLAAILACLLAPVPVSFAPPAFVVTPRLDCPAATQQKLAGPPGFA